jgi:hypothetical protein
MDVGKMMVFFDFRIIMKVLLTLIIGYILIYIIRSIFTNWSNISSPGNISAIIKSQNSLLETRWAGNLQMRQGIAQGFSKVPQPQQLLINTAVLSTRLVGYLGPFSSGVFDEDNATRLALTSGARCLVLEIDYMNNTFDPILVYRDGWGSKRSLNTGNIQTVAASISARAFKPDNNGAPPSVASDPLILVLYFVRAPNKSSQPIEYIKYLGAVAEKLAPLKDYILAQTPQGDFRRQALESQLFFTSYTAFQNKIIVLTNADTTPFRNLGNFGLAGEIGIKQDLDFMVNARLYSRESPSPFGITGSPSSTVKPAAVITSANYWIMTPTDRTESAVQSTKEAWTLVMPPVSSETNQINMKDLNSLLSTYGVNSIPITLFSDAVNTDIFTGKGKPFNTASWVAKPNLIQYVPPVPIPISKPFPQANSGGGTVVSPKL